MDLMQALRESQVRENRPEVAIGDFVKVHVKVKEGSRERIQVFEVVRHGKVRRAKLYYLRGRVGKAAKVKEKI